MALQTRNHICTACAWRYQYPHVDDLYAYDEGIV